MSPETFDNLVHKLSHLVFDANGKPKIMVLVILVVIVVFWLARRPD